MNYVDIIIIAVVAFMALWGLWKSFTKTLIKIICFGLAVFATYLVANYIINWLLGIEFVRGLIVDVLGGWYESAIAALGGASNATGALGNFIAPIVARYDAVSAIYNLTLDQFVALTLAINTLNVILCILLYLIIRLVVWLVAWILSLILVHGQPNWFSRLLGFACGAVRGAALVMVLLIASTAILPFGWAKNYNEDLGEKSVIGKVASQYTYQIYDWAVYGNDAQKTIKLLESAGIDKK